jgi:hypothetical protein
MPALELYVEPVRLRNMASAGDFILELPAVGLGRIPLRQLTCVLRVPRVPGARRAVIDTGAPLSHFPHQVWAHEFNWREGRDFDILPVVGDPTLRGQLLGYSYTFRLARLRVPVTLAGQNLSGPRLQVDSLVTQFSSSPSRAARRSSCSVCGAAYSTTAGWRSPPPPTATRPAALEF